MWADLLLMEPLPTVKMVPFDCLDSFFGRLVEVLVLELFIDLIFSGIVVPTFVISIDEELRLMFP